jgi:hypothetical protein
LGALLGKQLRALRASRLQSLDPIWRWRWHCVCVCGGENGDV